MARTDKRRKDDVKFRSLDGIWKFTLYTGNHKDPATKSITFFSDDPDVRVESRSWQSKNLLTFRPSTHEMCFEEKYQIDTSIHGSVYVSKGLVFDKDNMRFYGSYPALTRDENGGSIVGRAIVWRIRDGLQATPVKGNVRWLSHGPKLLRLHWINNWLRQVKFVQFLVRDCNNTHMVGFNASNLIEIMGGREIYPASSILTNAAPRERVSVEVSEGVRRLRTRQLANELFGRIWEQELEKYKASRKAGTGD